MFESWEDKSQDIKAKIDDLIGELVSELSAEAIYEVSMAVGDGYIDGYNDAQKDAQKEFVGIRNVLERYDRDNSQCHVCNRIGPHSPECVFQSIYNILDN